MTDQLYFLGWVAALLVALFAVAGFKPLQRWHLRHIPGPSPRWYLGNLPEMRKMGNYKYNEQLSKEYGQVFKVFGPLAPNVVVTSPELIRHVLMHNSARPQIPSLLSYSTQDREFDAASILQSKGNRWRSIRQAWTPMFFTGSLEGYAQLMNDCASHLLERLHVAAADDAEMDIWQVMGDMTMHVIGTAAFGVDFNTQASQGALSSEQQAEVEQLRATVKGMFTTATGMFTSKWFLLLLFIPRSLFPVLRMLANWLPDKRMREAMKMRRAMMGIATRIVAQHRRDVASSQQQAVDCGLNHPADGTAKVELLSPAGAGKALGRESSRTGDADPSLRRGVAPGSFMDLLVKANFRGTGQKFNDTEIVSQAFTAILAGYETTANALTFTLYCLSANPDKQELLLKEIDAYGDGIPSYADLDAHFPYLDAVLKEAMRLYPPVTFAIRSAEHDLTLAGHAVPKDTFISASVWTMHHDESVYHHPYEYIPERWIDGTPESSGRPTNCLLPFGEGPRKCPAARFAIEEAKIALIRTYQRFVFKLSPGQVPLKLQHTITLAPKGGLHVTPQFRDQTDKLLRLQVVS